MKEALHERLLEIDWMSDDTRAEAIRKMEKFRVKIGFPVRVLILSITVHFMSLLSLLCLSLSSVSSLLSKEPECPVNMSLFFLLSPLTGLVD